MTRWASVSKPKQVTFDSATEGSQAKWPTKHAAKVTHPVKRLAWRDEPAVKLKQVELDQSFMQIDCLLLEPEDS